MHPHLFPTICLSFVVISINLIHFPFSSYATDQFRECSAPFECAWAMNLNYPFWGPDRPSYCGHPAFELNCSGGDPVMKIKDMNYIVLDIHNDSRTLKVAREDYRNKFCPAAFVNTTIDFTIFSYSSGTTNLTIYYGCPLPGQPNSLTCSINGTEFATYTSGDSILNSFATAMGGCLYNVKVPVHQEAVGTGVNLTKHALTNAIDGGFMLGWDANNSLCSACQARGGVCGYNTSMSSFACYCANGVTCGSTPSGERSWKQIVLTKVLLPISIFVVVISFVIICMKRLHSPIGLMIWKRDTKHDHLNTEEIMKNFGSIVPKRYTYSDVKKLTNSFKEKVRQGGYGIVYKGKLFDGRVVAVKILNESKGNGEEFINEVVSISRTSHVNVVTLLGFCYERTKRALIYEFMLNGSLDKLIYDKGSSIPNSHLDIKTMFQIAIGIARGLEYLHRGCNTRILHFDIKPHNILLDEDLCPKISDFGLAKLCKPKESIVSMAGMRGTARYIAPEVFNRYFGKVSHKFDVYSYGMLVLEINGTRKRNCTRDSRGNEVYFPDDIYKKLEQGESFGVFEDTNEEEEDMIKKMIIMSLWCIQINPSDRPSMHKVIEMLEGSLESLQVPPKPSFDCLIGHLKILLQLHCHKV